MHIFPPSTIREKLVSGDLKLVAEAVAELLPDESINVEAFREIREAIASVRLRKRAVEAAEQALTAAKTSLAEAGARLADLAKAD